MKCISCRKKKGLYKHFSGGKVCESCIGGYFTCPDCGLLFDRDDYENADSGTGYCARCAPKH